MHEKRNARSGIEPETSLPTKQLLTDASTKAYVQKWGLLSHLVFHFSGQFSRMLFYCDLNLRTASLPDLLEPAVPPKQLTETSY